jgi:ABC-type Zn uptake system ZnuABC Zn-binding protein ZnuA
VAAVALLLIAGCGSDPATAGGDGGGPQGVVATTPVVADLARNVAGDRADVRSMLDAKADPHDYEVRPRDVEALADAGLIVRSGGELDQWLTEAIDGAGAKAPVLTLIDRIDPIAGGHVVPGERAEGGAESADEVDPHWWHDPGNAAKAVAAIRDALSKADPDGRATYARNADAYLRRIDRLTTSTEACVAKIPQRSRKLVTTHDALGYYASRFGFEIVGAVIPSLSTAGQPSAGDTAALVETIRRERVPAVFAEQSVSADTERAVAEEAGARFGAPLWTDTLGPKGSGADTYLGAEAANTHAIVDGLTAGREQCTPRS